MILSGLVGKLYKKYDYIQKTYCIQTNGLYPIQEIRLYLQLKYNFGHTFLIPRIYMLQSYSRNSIVQNCLEFSWKQLHWNSFQLHVYIFLISLITINIHLSCSYRFLLHTWDTTEILYSFTFMPEWFQTTLCTWLLIDPPFGTQGSFIFDISIAFYTVTPFSFLFSLFHTLVISGDDGTAGAPPALLSVVYQQIWWSCTYTTIAWLRFIRFLCFFCHGD